MVTAGRSIIAAEGPKGLLTGFAPTAVGYLFQGGAKFVGYEFFVSSRSLYPKRRAARDGGAVRKENFDLR